MSIDTPRAPLAAKQSRTFWVSTDGVMTPLDPDIQQQDKAHPTGGIMLHLFEGRDGAPASTEFVNDKIAGATATLLDYKVEVLRVVWGKDTTLEDRSLVTRGNVPAGSVLIRVTRLQVTPRPY